MLTKVPKSLVVGVVALLLAAASATASAPAGIHWDLQAVDVNGVGTWSGTTPVTVTGVILNNHENMLDPVYDAPEWMGGQWQIFIQPTDPADHAGTACWMGQKYGNLPWVPDYQSHTGEEWYYELNRLNYDNGNPFTGHHFRAGDRVQVVAPNVGFYGGKTNINEGHSKDPARDFTVTLLEANYGLPTPEAITLADLYVDSGVPDYNPAYPLFDPSRLSGGEYYQGRRVRLNGLTLVDDSGWGEEKWGDRVCTIAGADQVDFKLRMPRGSMVDLNGPPAGAFDVIGILNQESGSGSDGRFGYEVFVTEIAALAGDFDEDLDVDGDDFLIWQNGYPTGSGAALGDGDADGDGDVDGDDFLIWQNNYPYPSHTPEPASLLLLAVGGLAMLRRRRR